MNLFAQKSLLAKLMATEDLTVRQARVHTASFDVQNRVLTVPILDKDVSKDVYDLFMGHESAHAIWTPLDGMKKAKSEKVNMSVLNVVEDARIERRIKNKFPGIKTPFINAYKTLFDENFFETEGEDLNEFNFIDRVNLHCKIGASLALNFSEEERKLLDEVESTQTFDDVIEVTKKICEFMKDQLNELPEKTKKIKVVVHGAQGGESGEKNAKSEDEDEEYDEEIHIQLDESEEKSGEGEEKTDGTGKSEEKADGEEGKSDSTEAGSGASRNEQQLEAQIRSFTDDAYKRNEEKLFSDGNEKYLYVNIPKYDTSKIMDYKVMLSKVRAENYIVDSKVFNNYRREANKVVSYLVKEFELRKNADQMKRAATAKTGELNMNRLYSYNFTEDIFKKITVMPQGKSHGLVMYIDWSGSMIRHLENTVKQLLNLVMFCKKVNIPFEVYSFIEDTDYEYMAAPKWKAEDLSMRPFGIINLLSNRMNASDFTFAAGVLMKMAGCDSGRRWNDGRMPRFMMMSGTPLNEAVISAFEIVPEFQKRNRLQIVNTVFLTDGEGCMLQNSYDRSGFVSHNTFSHMVMRDPKTRHEEMFERNVQFSAMYQTDSLVRLLKQRTNSHVIGFFVGETKDVMNRIGYFWPEFKDLPDFTAREEFREKTRTKFRKDNSVIVTSTGYDDYYILRSTGLDTDDDEELTFKENATTRGMATAFAKYTGNKIASRVVLNRFIGLIS